MLIYHGSDHIIKQPVYKGGKRNNDYGYGFHTTQYIMLAKEWACSKNQDGYVNIYEAALDNLKILNLNSPEYSILNWLALLTKYRTYWQNGSISEAAKTYLQKNFFIDPDPYDVIIGYRADDSYFSFAQDFVAGAISLAKLSEAMHLGKLGEQIVFKSQKAFSHLNFIGVEDAVASVYFKKKDERDKEARQAYRKTRSSADSIDDIFIIDIVREKIKNDDPRIR